MEESRLDNELKRIQEGFPFLWESYNFHITFFTIDMAGKLTDESANELAEKISKELGGKKVWISAKTNSIYVSSPPAEGFLSRS